MNDFTKEELEDIYIVYKIFCSVVDEADRRILTGLKPGILNRLKSMIDNYCNHERTSGCYDCNTAMCLTCNKRFEYE